MFDCVWPTRTAVSALLYVITRFTYSETSIFPKNLSISPPSKRKKERKKEFQKKWFLIPMSQRFGNALTSTGTLNLRHASHASAFEPLEANCTCICCLPPSNGGLGITRAYIHHITNKETVGAHLYVFTFCPFPPLFTPPLLFPFPSLYEKSHLKFSNPPTPSFFYLFG